MTSVIVIDACCLIDLHKVNLVSELYKLPYKLVIPEDARRFEVLHLPQHQWQELDEAGLITHRMTYEESVKTSLLKDIHHGLSTVDCFCLVITQSYSGILLTGDSPLREVAKSYDLETHGVFWIVDQLDEFSICPRSHLIGALNYWKNDKYVFLPEDEILARLNKFKI